MQRGPARTAVLLNAGSGTVRSMGPETARLLISTALAESGAGADVIVLEGSAIEETVKRLLAGGECRRIIVGGGDGTVTSVAGLLAGSDIVMGVLPLGTMNLLSKALGIAPDLGEALKQLQDAEVREIDAARVADRLFLHHVSFGIQPRMVRIRERLGYSSRLTKMLAGARAMIGVLLRPQSQRLVVEIDGMMQEIRTPALLVSNNVYDGSVWLKQGRLDEGVLGLYAMRPMSKLGYLRLAFDLLRGRWLENANVLEDRGHRVVLAKRRRLGHLRKNIRATVDGELTLLPLPLTLSSEPAALRMLVPRPPAP